MCRIFGVSYGPGGAAAEEWTPTEIAQIMFPALTRGGKHAWGWAAAIGEDIWTDKHPGRADEPEAIKLMDLPENPLWIIGHTRHATHGSPEDNRNNHPIQHGKIVGVHNGVLLNHQEVLKKTGRWVEGTEVDSEAIFAAINKWGHKKGLSRVMGSMVAVYADINFPRTINIARSKGRDMFIARTKTKALYWASQTDALESLGIKFSSIESVGSNQLIRVKGGRITGRQAYQPPLEAPRALPAAQTLTGRVGGGLPPRTPPSALRAVVGGSGGSGGLRARRERRARQEALDEAHEFITRQREELGIAPRFGEKRNSLYWVGGNMGWITEKEFIAFVLDEKDWH